MLLIQGLQTFYIAFGFCSLCFVLFQLRLGFLHLCLIKSRINNEKRFVLLYFLSFHKQHLFQITFDTSMYFHEPGCPDASDIFTKNLYIFLRRFINNHKRPQRFILMSTSCC